MRGAWILAPRHMSMRLGLQDEGGHSIADILNTRKIGGSEGNPIGTIGLTLGFDLPNIGSVIHSCNSSDSFTGRRPAQGFASRPRFYCNYRRATVPKTPSLPLLLTLLVPYERTFPGLTCFTPVTLSVTTVYAKRSKAPVPLAATPLLFLNATLLWTIMSAWAPAENATNPDAPFPVAEVSFTTTETVADVTVPTDETPSPVLLAM